MDDDGCCCCFFFGEAAAVVMMAVRRRRRRRERKREREKERERESKKKREKKGKVWEKSTEKTSRNKIVTTERERASERESGCWIIGDLEIYDVCAPDEEGGSRRLGSRRRVCGAPGRARRRVRIRHFFFSPFPIGPETPEQGKTKRGLPEWVSSPPIHPCTGIKTQRHRHQAIVATAAAAAAAAAARIGEGERKKHTDSSSCCDDCLTDAGVATASLTSALADCLDVCLRDVAD